MKKVKSIIAIICAVACLVVSGLTPAVNTVAANYPQELKEIYPIDFGVEDGTYSRYNSYNNTYSGDSLLNTVFTMDVKFSGTDMYFNYAGTSQWVGMIFKVYEDSIVMQNNGDYGVLESSYTFTSDAAGTKFKDTTFRFGISLEACNNDGGTLNNDIKIGIYFNHVLYNNTYIYAHNVTDKIGNILYFLTNPLAHDKLSVYEISSPVKENSDNFYKLSPADFGVLDGTHTDTQKDINVGLDGKLFSTDISFNESGEYIDYSGIKLESDGFGGITISDSTGNESFQGEKVYTDISDLTAITYTDFGFSSGVDTVGVYGTYKESDSLNNTYFSAKFKFYPNGNVPQLLFGGRNNSWGGIRVKYSHDVITVDNTKTYAVDYEIYPTDISRGMSTFEDSNGSGWSKGIDIGISLRYGDYDGDGLSDDVEYGIFIMGKLAHNKYTYIMDFAGTEENTESSKMGLDCRIYLPSTTVTDEETGEETVYKSSFELAQPISHPALDTDKFNLEIATKAVNGDTDGEKDDLEAKIYINNTLMKEIVIADYESKLTYKLSVNADIINPERALSYKDEVLSFEDLGIANGASVIAVANKKLTVDSTKIFSGNVDISQDKTAAIALNTQPKITFRDFGISDGDYKLTNEAVGSFDTTLDGYLFSGNLKFVASESFYYGGTAAYKGILFALNGARLKISDFNGNQLASISTSSTNGAVTSFRSTEFTLGLAVTVKDTDSDGQKDDVCLGVWFNGVFYNTYNIVDGANSLGGYISATSILTNNTITLTSADMNFADEDVLKVLDAVPKTEIKVFDISNVSSSAQFGFDLEIEKASLDDDRVKNDLAITLYIDGKAHTVQLFKDIDISNLYLGFECDGIAVSDRLPEASLGERVYSLHIGDFALMGVGDITVNRESGHLSGEILDTPGEYTIVRTYLGKEYAEKVELWKAGYINSDDDVNILDFVVAQKYMAGEENATYIRKGADLDFDGNVTAKDIVKVKRILLGLDTVPEAAQTDKWSFKEDEMPIVGFFSPKTMYLDGGSQDLTVDLCTDEVFKLISDLGINFLNYIESQYNELAYGLSLENKNCTVKNLELASKYGIGSVVWLAGTQSENSYLDTISRFSHYSAFEGINIIDEPYSSTYYDPDKGPIDEMTSAAERYKLMASYTNLYGYANLFPYVLSMTGKDNNEEGYEVYREYLREFCQKFNPKVLSWDHYVLNAKNYKNYYKNLEIGRDVAKEFDIPFWTFMQAGDTGGRTGSSATTTTTEEMLWNLNTMLAYGAKGIQYYTLVQPYGSSYVDKTDSYDFDAAGLIAANGEKTKYYDQALAVNNQVKAVDHVLVNSDSKDILAIGGAQSETGITKTAYGVITSAEATAERGAIIGCFDYRGKQAFYVASNSFDEAQTVTFNFDGTHSLELIATNLDTTVTADSYTVNLAAGEAVLIVVD